MGIREMREHYVREGLNRELANARVCQDIILKAISEGDVNKNITLKGGVVMRSISGDKRRATRDIDLDFIRYPLDDTSIMNFVKKLNSVKEFAISINGEMEELKHQDYHGKRIYVSITDQQGESVESKIDIGVHRHLELEQDIYCFDVCMDEKGVSLLKNSVEQTFVEKLRALLKFGPDSRRYKDIYDMCKV